MPSVLLVEDDAALGGALRDALADAGYAVSWERSGPGGASCWTAEAGFDLVVLDLGLPGRDGLAVLADARARGLDTPVLVLTARDLPQDRVVGLDAGADDYLVKPFHRDELQARLRALLRRRGGDGPAGRGDAGALRLEAGERRAHWRGREVELTASEYELLACLHHHAGSVVPRDRLEAVLQRSARTPGSNTLDVYVHRLRRKLHPEAIRTIHGIGYRFEPDAGGDEGEAG